MLNKEEIYSKWLEYKQLEDKYKDLRVDMEREIYVANQVAIEEKGLGTVRDEHGPFSVTIVMKESASWDQDGLSTLGRLPFKSEYKVDKRNLDLLKKNDSSLYNMVMSYCTTKPSKPSFKVEIKDV